MAKLGAMLRILTICFVAVGFGMVVGCETTPTSVGNTSGVNGGVDNKPWSTPESWEGGSAFGQFNQGR